MRDRVHALLGPIGHKNGWQPAGYAGHSTPDGLQRLPDGATWDADDVRDDLQTYVAGRLGEDGGVLILDDTGAAPPRCPASSVSASGRMPLDKP